MADNLVDALADDVEAWGRVNERVWADEAAPRKADGSPGATFPYCTIVDGISLGPSLKGDTRTLVLERQMQLNLWERLDAEDPDAAATLIAFLDGRKATLESGHRVRWTVDSAARLPEVDTNIAHRALTIGVRHDPAVP